jgi:hypothetical protein
MQETSPSTLSTNGFTAAKGVRLEGASVGRARKWTWRSTSATRVKLSSLFKFIESLVYRKANERATITWDEWFDNFERYGLTFVYEREVADRAHELWDARGRTNGHDTEDWHKAERQLGHHGTGPSARYRFVTDDGVSRPPGRA